MALPPVDFRAHRIERERMLAEEELKNQYVPFEPRISVSATPVTSDDEKDLPGGPKAFLNAVRKADFRARVTYSRGVMPGLEGERERLLVKGQRDDGAWIVAAWTTEKSGEWKSSFVYVPEVGVRTRVGISAAKRWLQDVPSTWAGLECSECGGLTPRTSRGLCQKCYDAARRSDTLIDYPRVFKKADDVLDDFVELSDQGFTREQIADRLEMKLNTLDQVISRARRRGDPRADAYSRRVLIHGDARGRSHPASERKAVQQ